MLVPRARGMTSACFGRAGGGGVDGLPPRGDDGSPPVVGSPVVGPPVARPPVVPGDVGAEVDAAAGSFPSSSPKNTALTPTIRPASTTRATSTTANGNRGGARCRPSVDIDVTPHGAVVPFGGEASSPESSSHRYSRGDSPLSWIFAARARPK